MEPLVSLTGLVQASATSGSAFGGGVMQFLPFVAIIAIMYFLMIRPQQKKEKQRQAMVAALKRGDRVLTTGGMIGTVHKVLGGGELLIEISEGNRVRFLAGAVTQLMDKTATVHPQEEKAADTSETKEVAKKTPVKKETAKKTAATGARKTSATRKSTSTRAKKTGSS